MARSQRRSAAALNCTKDRRLHQTLAVRLVAGCYANRLLLNSRVSGTLEQAEFKANRSDKPLTLAGLSSSKDFKTLKRNSLMNALTSLTVAEAFLLFFFCLFVRQPKKHTIK